MLSQIGCLVFGCSVILVASNWVFSHTDCSDIYWVFSHIGFLVILCDQYVQYLGVQSYSVFLHSEIGSCVIGSSLCVPAYM